jgi:hypothetical protein
MAEDSELKKSIKGLVKEIVSDTVSKLVKASATKTATALRDKLKEEATRRVEDKLKKTARGLEKDFSGDTAQDSEYLKKLRDGFEKDLEKHLSSLSRGLLKPLIITSVCTLIIGGFIGWIIVERFIEPPSQPDLVITWVEPEWTEADEGVIVYYRVTNLGEEKAGESYTNLNIDGSPVTEDYVAPLGPGEGRLESFPAYLFSEEQVLCMELYVDCDLAIEECNEENNVTTIEITCPEPKPPPQPDLVITGITFQLEAEYGVEPELDVEIPGDIYKIAETFAALGTCPPLYQLTIHYTIENQGEAEAGQSSSCLYLCGELIAEDTVYPLAAGETSEESFSYYPFLRELFYYYFCYAYDDIDLEVYVDCSQNVAESREDNNCLTLKFNQPQE